MPAETHSHRGPIDRAELERIVREQLAEILEVDPDAITTDARLRDDLDADDYALHRARGSGRGRARASAWSASRSTTKTSPTGSTVRDAIECVVGRLGAMRHATATDGARRDRRQHRIGEAADAVAPTASTSSRRRSACTSTTGRCSLGRSRTARGAQSTTGHRRTSGSSSSATRCSASSSPTTCSRTSRTSPKASCRRCAPAS